MSNLKYGAFVSFDVQKDGVVTLNNSDKYYVKGLRKSGRDNSETDELEASRYSVTVKGDADYVVAYGIKGNQVAYTVNYQDADGKELKIEITDIRNQAGKTVEDIYEKAGIYEIEVRAEDAYEKQTVSRFRIPVNGGGV